MTETGAVAGKNKKNRRTPSLNRYQRPAASTLPVTIRD
jgi:hypothetical protein